MRIDDTFPEGVLGNFPVIVLDVPPAHPIVGTAWLDTTNQEIKVWDGQAWVENKALPAVPLDFLPLAGGVMRKNAPVDFNTGPVNNLILDFGRF